jgi:hypothetical protein
LNDLKSAAGKIASDLAALLVPVTVVALSRHAILDQFWLYDDAFHLRYVSHHTVAQYFVSPSAWRETRLSTDFSKTDPFDWKRVGDPVEQDQVKRGSSF